MQPLQSSGSSCRRPGDLLVADDVRDDGPAAPLEDAVDLVEELLLEAVLHQVEHAIRDDHVHRVVRDHGLVAPQFVRPLFDREQALDAVDRGRGDLLLEAIEVERQILDPAAPELDVGKAGALGHDRRIAPRHLEHVRRHVDTDHPPLGPDHLRGDEADLARAATEIEHRLSGLQVLRRVAAAVVALDHLGRDDLQVARVVVDRAAELLDLGVRALAVPLSDVLLDFRYGHL